VASPGGPEVELPVQLPGIALALGLTYAAGRRAHYRTILARFLELKAGTAEAIHEALERRDLEAASNLAHAMIASAGMIGAERLSALARRFQVAIEAGDPDAIAASRTAFEAQLKVVLDGLRAYFDPPAALSGPHAGRGAPPGDSAAAIPPAAARRDGGP